MKVNYAGHRGVMFNSSEIHSLICSINIYREPGLRPLLKGQDSLGGGRPRRGPDAGPPCVLSLALRCFHTSLIPDFSGGVLFFLKNRTLPA